MVSRQMKAIIHIVLIVALVSLTFNPIITQAQALDLPRLVISSQYIALIY